MRTVKSLLGGMWKIQPMEDVKFRKGVERLHFIRPLGSIGLTHLELGPSGDEMQGPVARCLMDLGKCLKQA